MVRKNTEKLKLGDQRTVIQEKGYLPQNLHHYKKNSNQNMFEKK